MKYYLRSTTDIREAKEELFGSFKKVFKKDIGKNTVSFLLRKAICVVYEMSSMDTRELHRVSA